MNKTRLFLKFKHSRYIKRAKKKSQDKDFLNKTKKASLKLGEKVKKATAKVKTLLDYVFGKGADLGMRIQAIAALIYFISPLDFIPDIIPGIGFLDDIALLGMIVGMITSKIIKKDDSLELADVTKETMQIKNKENTISNPSAPIVDNIFNRAKEHIDKATQEQVSQRIRAQFIIVIISISGAIIAAIVTLLLKFYFKVI